jgi:hypothetical protein
MELSILAVLAVISFCFCCRHLMAVVVEPLPASHESNYSKAALRLKRQYEVFAWSVMTAAFLVGLVVSFYQVYTQL